MFNLVYVSRSTSRMTHSQILALQQSAIQANMELGVTGVLLHNKGTFVQLLEGESPRLVLNLYTKICRDSRHGSVRVLAAGEIDSRVMQAWSMGLLDLDEHSYVSFAAFDELVQKLESGSQSSGSWDSVIELFEQFRSAVEKAA